MDFSYTAEQRRAIGDELTVESGYLRTPLDESLDEIEILVRLTIQAGAYRQDHLIEENSQQRFRSLDKPIDQIISVLDASEFQHLHDSVPNLRQELSILLRMVEADHRKGPGRPPDPAIELDRWLITKLAEVWARHHEGWPKRWYRDDKGRDWGPFYRFLETCLKPADIQVSDYIIRKALRVGHK